MAYDIKDYTRQGLATIVDDAKDLLVQTSNNLRKCGAATLTSPRVTEVLVPLAKANLQEVIKMLQDVEAQL